MLAGQAVLRQAGSPPHKNYSTPTSEALASAPGCVQCCHVGHALLSHLLACSQRAPQLLRFSSPPGMGVAADQLDIERTENSSPKCANNLKDATSLAGLDHALPQHSALPQHRSQPVINSTHVFMGREVVGLGWTCVSRTPVTITLSCTQRSTRSAAVGPKGCCLSSLAPMCTHTPCSLVNNSPLTTLAPRASAPPCGPACQAPVTPPLTSTGSATAARSPRSHGSLQHGRTACGHQKQESG